MSGSKKPLEQRDVFTTGDIARMCNVAPRTVTKWFDAGILKGYRIPGSTDRRIPRGVLFNFMKDHNMPMPEWLAIDALPFREGDYVRCKFRDRLSENGTIIRRGCGLYMVRLDRGESVLVNVEDVRSV